jgi:hypothetical protein
VTGIYTGRGLRTRTRIRLRTGVVVAHEIIALVRPERAQRVLERPNLDRRKEACIGIADDRDLDAAAYQSCCRAADDVVGCAKATIAAASSGSDAYSKCSDRLSAKSASD